MNECIRSSGIHKHLYSILEYGYDSREGFVRREKCTECDEIRIVVFSEEERRTQNKIVREMCSYIRDRTYHA